MVRFDPSLALSISLLLYGKFWNPRANNSSYLKNTIISGIAPQWKMKTPINYREFQVRHIYINHNSFTLTPFCKSGSLLKGQSQIESCNTASINCCPKTEPAGKFFYWISNLKTAPANFSFNATPNDAMLIRHWYDHSSHKRGFMLLSDTMPGPTQACGDSHPALQTHASHWVFQASRSVCFQKKGYSTWKRLPLSRKCCRVLEEAIFAA